MHEHTLPSKDTLVRHADKGKWTINEEELKSDPHLKPEEVKLIMTVLKGEFPDLKETPLMKDGLIRSLRLGDKMFTEIVNYPEFKSSNNQAVLITVDSGRDRAELTRALATYRIAQLESQNNKNKSKDEQVRIDSLHLEAKEFTKMMADSDDSTWGPYGKMIEEGSTEAEAVLQWLKDMNQPDSGVDPAIHPKESGERYKNIIQQIHKRVNIKDVPMFIFGAGHSGSLGQLKYEKMGDQMMAEDSPTFCEMHGFDAEGNLLSTKRVDMYTGESYQDLGSKKMERISNGVTIKLSDHGRERLKNKVPDREFTVIHSSYHDGNYTYKVIDEFGNEFSLMDFDIEPSD